MGSIPADESKHRRRSRALMALPGVLAPAGCNAVGPQTLGRGPFDCNEEVTRSWKEQTLLDIVPDGQVQWRGGSAAPLATEREAGPMHRLTVHILSWLPIEWPL